MHESPLGWVPQELTVTETEVSLGRQEEGVERFGPDHTMGVGDHADAQPRRHASHGARSEGQGTRSESENRRCVASRLFSVCNYDCSAL